MIRGSKVIAIPLVIVLSLMICSQRTGFILEGDALSLTQGRTTDVLLGIQYNLDDNFAIKAGYRVLEGSTDVEEIYNLRMINYVVIGPTLTF